MDALLEAERLPGARVRGIVEAAAHPDDLKRRAQGQELAFM